MALRSPTEFHSYWGNGFAAYADLPNVTASTTQSANLQVGDLAYVPTEGLYYNIVATLNAAVWQLLDGGTAGAVLDLYVSDVNGNDANNGLTPATALKTLTAARTKYGGVRDFDVIVHIGVHGGAGYTWATVDNVILNNSASIYFYGDGAGQPGEDGTVILKAAAAAAAGTTSAVVKSAGLVANAYRGYTLEILSGAASGRKTSVDYNTATDVVPASIITGLAPGDSYRITKPSVIIAVPNYPTTPALLCRGTGHKRGWVEAGLSDYTQPSAIYFVQMQMPLTFGFVRAEDSLAIFYGVNFGDSGAFGILTVDNTECGYGETDQTHAFADAIAPSSTAWKGWGIRGGAIYWAGSSEHHGYLVADQLFMTGDDIHGTVRGGDFIGGVGGTIVADSINASGAAVIEIGDNFAFGGANALNIRSAGGGGIGSLYPCIQAAGPASTIQLPYLATPGKVILTSSSVGIAATDGGNVIAQHGPDTGVEVHCGTFGLWATGGGVIGVTHDWILAFIANPSGTADCTLNGITGRPVTELTITEYSAFCSAGGQKIYRN